MDNVEQVAVETLALAIVVGIVSAVALGFLTFILLKAADKPAPTMVTLSLSMVTILSLVGFAVTKEEVLAAIVGTGAGALAGAVTSQLGSAQGPPKVEQPSVQPPPAVPCEPSPVDEDKIEEEK